MLVADMFAEPDAGAEEIEVQHGLTPLQIRGVGSPGDCCEPAPHARFEKFEIPPTSGCSSIKPDRFDEFAQIL